MSIDAAARLTGAPLLRRQRQPLRLETLVGLRWLAVSGQLASVLIVHYGLGYPAPLPWCMLLISMSALLNLALIFRQISTENSTGAFPVVQLCYDTLQLGGLLALTGGLENPFCILLLAPVAAAAITLSRSATIGLALLACVVASLLTVWHLPLPWDPHKTFELDDTYVFGIWAGVICGVVFVAAYTHRVAHESRQLSDALAATELALSRHEQLNALDGLAAAAAHELGTPLSTITLAAKEMRNDVESGPLAEDIDLIIAQTARCRAILGKLRDLGAGSQDPFATVRLGDLIAEAAKPLEQEGPMVTVDARGDGSIEPVLRRTVGLLYGLGNLIENATQFARGAVSVSARWDGRTVAIVVADDGPGFAPDLLTRLGEPYLTTRARNLADGESSGGGLGLGIFIAKTLLERTGARLRFENGAPEGHARITITWPRTAVDVGPRASL